MNFARTANLHTRLSQVARWSNVNLNRAIAVAFCRCSDACLAVLDHLNLAAHLRERDLMHATQADPHRRAEEIVPSLPERRFDQGRLKDLPDREGDPRTSTTLASA